MSFTDEKTSAQEVAISSPASPGIDLNHNLDLDNAFKFIKNVDHGSFDVGSIDLKALRRKIDWRLIPIMFLCSVMQFLDKINLNVCLPPSADPIEHIN